MRCGPHYQGWPGRKTQFRRWVDALRPPMVKFVAEGLHDDLIAYAKERGCVTVGRRVYHESEYSTSRARHQDLVNGVVEWAQAHPGIDVWCAPVNEFYHRGKELEKHAWIDVQHMEAMERIGKKAAIGLFALGTPEPDELERYRPALERCIAQGHSLELHEYAAPMQNLVGPNQGGQLVSAVTNWGREEGWTVLRFPKLLRAVAAMGLDADRLRIFVGESGNDIVTGKPGKPPPQPWPGRGYKDHDQLYRHWWTLDPRFGKYPQQRYWADRQYSHWKQIKGVVGFGFASKPATWNDFDASTDPATLDEILRLEATLPRLHYDGGGDMGDESVVRALRKEFGADFVDLRRSLKSNPHGPNGDYWRRSLRAIQSYAIHHTAVDTSWEAVARFHVDGNGWAGIGYHFGVKRGQVAYVGDMDTIRACVHAHNTEALCIAVMGDFTRRDPTAAETDRVRRLIRVLDGFLGREPVIRGHRQYPDQSTACPGSWVQVIPQLRDGPQVPAERPLRFEKIAWATEEAARILQREGMQREHDFVVEHYVADAVQRRDE